MSATDLIHYMLKHSYEYDWFVTVGDIDVPKVEMKIGGHPRGKAVYFDCYDEAIMDRYIKDSNIVISLLPPGMHAAAAIIALKYNVHVVTASYTAPEMWELDEEARQRGLTFLNELGADPGIDHMNGMRAIDKIKAKGGEILSFSSFCGSLVAPESNDHPWGYKFTWSPMNVVTMGAGGARYFRNSKLRCIPYHRLYTDPQIVEVPGHGKFEAYANRDSIPYCGTYGLDGIPTMIRATLRHPGFCAGWNAMVQIGLTANDYRIEDSDKMTYRQWLSCYLPGKDSDPIIDRLTQVLKVPKDSQIMRQILWTDVHTDRSITRENGTPAEILLDLLLEKWKFNPGDTDMLVFYDRQEYQLDGELFEHTAYMVTKGQDQLHTAISRTVGLPAAIGAKLILNGEINTRGVLLPIHKEVYDPILNELEEMGIGYESYERRIGEEDLMYS